MNLSAESGAIAARKREQAIHAALEAFGLRLIRISRDAEGNIFGVTDSSGSTQLRFATVEDLEAFIAEQQRSVADDAAKQAVASVAADGALLGFGGALAALKAGGKVTRVGWNGKGMFLYLVPGSTFQVNRAPLLGIYPDGTQINYLPHIDMRTADGSCVPWPASQTDLLAEDWSVVP